MTNNDTKAPERIWASYIRTQDGMWIGKHAAQDAPYKGATGYIRHDLHLSLVAAERNRCVDSLKEAGVAKPHNQEVLYRKDDHAILISTDAYISHKKQAGPWRSTFSMTMEDAVKLRDDLDATIRQHSPKEKTDERL